MSVNIVLNDDDDDDDDQWRIQNFCNFWCELCYFFPSLLSPFLAAKRPFLSGGIREFSPNFFKNQIAVGEFNAAAFPHPPN